MVWDPNIETVLGNQAEYNYVASYEETSRQYALTLKCSPAGAATMTGARADYTFGTNATITVAPNENYTFTGWSDGVGRGDETEGKYSREVTINDNIDLVANFTVEKPDATIYWKSMDGMTTYAEVSQKSGTATTYTGPITPTKDANAQYTYTFFGWSTAVNGGGVPYKNGLTPKAAEGVTTYYAYFNSTPNKYKVTLQTNNPDVCTLFGAGTYEYGTTAHIFAKVRDGYEFVKWSDDETNATHSKIIVSDDITLTAIVREAVKDKKVGIKSTYTVADGDIVNDLILESNGSASGQITNANALSVEGNAYFDLTLNANAETW